MKITKVTSKQIQGKKYIKECPICQKAFISSSDQDVDRQYNAHYFFKHGQTEEEDE